MFSRCWLISSANSADAVIRKAKRTNLCSVEEEALQREPQDIVEYLREQGVCLRQLAKKLEQNETIFL